MPPRASRRQADPAWHEAALITAFLLAVVTATVVAALILDEWLHG